MTDELKRLLIEYLADLDQWELLKIETPEGLIYMSFSRECIHGDPSNYEQIPP